MLSLLCLFSSFLHAPLGKEGRSSSAPPGARRTHVSVAQLVLAIGPDAGDGRGPGWLGEARGCPVRPRAMAAACFWAVQETWSCREALVVGQRQLVDGGL